MLSAVFGDCYPRLMQDTGACFLFLLAFNEDG